MIRVILVSRAVAFSGSATAANIRLLYSVSSIFDYLTFYGAAFFHFQGIGGQSSEFATGYYAGYPGYGAQVQLKLKGIFFYLSRINASCFSAIFGLIVRIANESYHLESREAVMALCRRSLWCR